MIPNLITAQLLLFLCSASTHPVKTPHPNPSQDEAKTTSEQPRDKVWQHKQDKRITEFRTPFDVLRERALGRSSKSLRFNWRKGPVQVGALVGHLSELNNFNSIRSGVTTRFPTSHLLLELHVAYVWVVNTRSSELLALTPYRQPARPPRLELGFGLAYPLAEGVVTLRPGFLPAAHLVLNAYADLRYLIYPKAFGGLGFGDAMRAVFSSTLTTKELENLEEERLGAMQIETNRLNTFIGLGADVYFQAGLYFSWKILMAVPILTFADDASLRFWYEISLSIGYAF
jgi:hypothetical protein